MYENLEVEIFESKVRSDINGGNCIIEILFFVPIE